MSLRNTKLLPLILLNLLYLNCFIAYGSNVELQNNKNQYQSKLDILIDSLIANGNKFIGNKNIYWPEKDITYDGINQIEKIWKQLENVSNTTNSIKGKSYVYLFKGIQQQLMVESFSENVTDSIRRLNAIKCTEILDSAYVSLGGIKEYNGQYSAINQLIEVLHEFGIDAYKKEELINISINSPYYQQDSLWQGKNYFYLAFILNNRLNYFEAAKNYEKAIELLATQQQYKMALTYQYYATFNLAEIYKKIDNPDKALEYLTQSTVLVKEGLKDTLFYLWDLGSLAKTYQEKGDLAKAKSYIDSIQHYLDVVNLDGKYHQRAHAYKQIGTFHQKNGDNERAIEYYRKIFDIVREMKNNHVNLYQAFSENTFEAFLGMHDIELENNNQELAKEYALQAFEHANISNNSNYILESAKKLKDAFSRSGNYKQSLYYADITLEYLQKVIDRDLQSQASKIQYENDLQSAQSKIESLVIKEELDKSKIFSQRFIIATIALLLILAISIIAFMYYISKEISEKQRSTLEYNRLLIKHKDETLKRNENLKTQLKSKLLLVSNAQNILNEIRVFYRDSQSLEEGQFKKEIAQVLKRNQINKSTINQIDVELSELDKKFYENVSTLHPNLTSRNLKLCSYLKMNLNSKEIAAIEHVSPSSVKVARSRLRKRLGLNDSSMSLSSYLHSISQN